MTEASDARGEGDRGLHNRVRALFHELDILAPDEREARLEALNPPAPVREALEELLELADCDDALEDSRIGEVAEVLLSPGDGADPALPERIDDYTILGKLGEGGMGVVYSGRGEGSSDLVAIKIIRPGVDVGRFRNRFRREVQVLEQLRHPGIAAFHGAGEARMSSPSGEVLLPYLVMELVEGEPMLAHAERRSLSDRDRIELVVQIASALHHAHERGIVHRDLKPANVLVERADEGTVGRPKLLDFGVALAVDTDLATLTATQTGALIGTLPYMSPEQVRGDGGGVDRRSDVYSLGVLTFELLSGRLPYSVRDCPLVEAARVIQEEDPTRLGSIATRHRGALELIVGKALEKEPERRYPTAVAFADDLSRFLRGEPVQARPVTKLRELRKLARRHRVLFAASIATFVALSIGLAASLWFALGEASARRLADGRTLEANRNLYRASLQTASDAMAAGDAGLVALELERAPEALRGWEWRVLEARTDTSLMRFETEVDNPLAGPQGIKLAFGRDGRFLTLQDEGRCMHWDLASGEATRFETPRPSALGPHGERWAHLADGELLISSIPSGGRLASVALREAPPAWGHLTFLDEFLVFQTKEATYRIDPLTGEVGPFEWLGYYPRWSMDAQGRWITRVDGALLHVLDSETGEKTTVDGGWTKAVASPDGRHVAGLAADGRLTTWRLEPGQAPLVAWRRQREANQPRVLAYSSDSKLLATAGVAPRVDLWDAASGEKLGSLTGHRSIARELRFSPDGEFLAAVAQDGDVRIWSIDDSLGVIPAGDYLYAAAFDAPGERLLVGNNHGELRFFDTRSSSEIGRLDLGTGNVMSIEIHADTGRCVVSLRGRGLRSVVLDPVTATVLWTRELDSPMSLAKSAFSPDGRSVIIAGAGGHLSTWDAASGAPIASVEREAEDQGARNLPHLALAIDPRSGRIACGEGRRIELFDPRTLDKVGELGDHGDWITDAAFSPDGTYLATASRGHSVQVWGVESEQLVAELVGHTQPVHGVCWSPDGTRLFSASRDTTIRVWDTTSWTDVIALRGHQDYVYSVRMNAAGDTLLSCGGDGTARVWRAETAARRWSERRRYEEATERLAPFVFGGDPEAAFEERATAIRNAEELDTREREIGLQLLLREQLRSER